MPFKPPLTLQDLQAIQQRNPDSADVRALLWEVKRLRSFVLRTHQLSGDLQRPAGVLATVFDQWMETLRAEPCVHEQEQLVSELLRKPR